MTDKDKFLADKVKALKGKYSKYQANQLALNMYEKEQERYAQQGVWNSSDPRVFETAYGQQPLQNSNVPRNPYEKAFAQPVPQNIGYQMSNLTSLPKQDFQMDYKRFNPQPLESNNPFADQVYNVPQDLGYTPKSFVENTQNVQPDTDKKYYDTNRVNITPPPMFGDPTYNLSQGMYNFGRGNTLGGIAGVGAGILGTVRNSLSGFAAGKEDRRVAKEYGDKLYDDNRRYNFSQQGGKLTNADLIAQNAVTDQEQGNVNVEGGEFIMRNNGQIQPVVGEPHIKNGKIADGVDTTLEGGDKVLSNYNKLKPADVKELKERYNLSLKNGTTFAEAQKKLDSKLGIKKLETEKADILVKMETASKIKDENSRQLSLQSLEKQTAQVNEKINSLSEIREGNFNFLFERQEKQPKKGDGSQLFDKDGKEVLQQGGKFTPNQLTSDTEKVAQVLNSEVDNNTAPITLRKIKNIQGGVTNDRFGDGYYIYYDKEPVDEGFDVNRHREFVTRDAFQNTVVRTPAYQDFKHLKPQENLLANFQQGGEFESIAQKYNISPERVRELISMQQGGEVPQQQAPDQMQQIFEAVAQMMQQGAQPEQVAQQLSQMGVPEEQIEQIIQEVSQQMQGVQQQTAQQGGEKEYAQQGKRETYEEIVARNNAFGTNSLEPGLWQGTSAEQFYNPYTDWEKYLGREPRNIKSHEIYQKGVTSDLTPQISQLITSGEMPLTNRHRDLLKKAGIKNANDMLNYTDIPEEYRKKLDNNFILDGYTDKLAGHRGVVVKPGDLTDEEYRKLEVKNYDRMTDKEGRQIYAKYDDKGKLLKDDKGNFTFYYPKKAGEPDKKVEPEKVSSETKDFVVQNSQQEITARDNVKNIQANFSTFIPTYSPMQPITKEEISIPRLDPIKMTPEPMLAEQERQRQTDVERVEQTGMSPQQQEAILAQGLASSQMASNDAISKVETWNAQNQFATDQYNVGAQTKEDIMNAQFRQDFQGKALQTLANQEADIENKRKSAFLQNQSDRKYVDQINMANMTSDQFALVPGQGIVTLNNKPFQMENDYRGLQKWMTNATPEQIFEFKKLTGQADATSTSPNPDLVSNIYGNKAATVKKKTKK
jgi:uncharacterized protein (DUF433 family)